MKLIFLSGPTKGHRYEIEDTVCVGRGNANDVVVPDPSVSLAHCRIQFERGGPFVRDLGSTNGTAINDNRVVKAELRHGDRLRLGHVEIRVEIPLAAGAAARDKSATQEMSGNIFGSVTYLLKRKLAEGGMGSVYEAEQIGAEGFIKKVAIKTILPSHAKKENFVASFVGEAKLAATLVHPNIVQIHHLGRHDGSYFIAMEYIDGINLTSFLVRHGDLQRMVPVEIATFLVSRIARGLDYAHAKADESGKPLGLVHRDVSPNNILITQEGEVKLTDFGVAKAAQFMEDDENYLVGSVEYMSPEQAACGPVDCRSDLFSLGLVYYEILTGIRVFRCRDGDIHRTVNEVKAAVVPDPSQYRKDLPDAMREILLRCLEREPDRRYPGARPLCEALERSIYSKGYGPTTTTLADYVKELLRDSA